MQINELIISIKKFPFVFLIFLLCIISSIRILQASDSFQQNHYVLLADSFLNGRLSIPGPLPNTATGDIATFKNTYFVCFGLMPAVLMIPFVLISKEIFSQHLLGITFLCIDFFLIYKIAKKIVSDKETAFWLSLFFIFGTVFSSIALVNFTSYQVQIIAVSFVIFALYEFFHQRRWLLIGVFLAFAGLTRPTAYLASIFFIIELFYLGPYQKIQKKLAYLILPILLSAIILGFYNFLRFDNFLETGYTYQATIGQLQGAVSKGLLSYKHIPGNLFFLLFKGPEPVRINSVDYQLKPPFLKADYWGMGIFFTSPLFLYLFSSKIKKVHILSAWITFFIMLIPIISFFGIGIAQFGYRYSVDFSPFLFLILTYIFKERLPLRAKALIIYSILFNFYFMLSIWGIYPF